MHMALTYKPSAHFCAWYFRNNSRQISHSIDKVLPFFVASIQNRQLSSAYLPMGPERKSGLMDSTFSCYIYTDCRKKASKVLRQTSG